MDESTLAADEGEYLDPGYDPQTPDGDNLLLDFSRAEKALWSSWGAAVDASIGSDDDLGVSWVDSGSASVFGNPVLWSRPLDVAAAKQAVAATSSVFSERDGGPYLLYSTFPTPDLREFGMHPVGHPPCMVRMPGDAGSTAELSTLHIDRVGDAQGLAAFERVFIEGYPVPELDARATGSFMGTSLLNDERWHLFVGYADGEAVATAAAFVTSEVVDVTLVATAPRARRRGFGRAMTHAAVAADPHKPAMLLSSDDGQPVYRSIGFRTIARHTLWIGQRG